MSIELLVNGKRRTVTANPGESLLAVLREELGLTGAKYGCGEGQCGACSVLLDGRATHACITPATAAVGHAITTIEGLEDNAGRLHAVQQAFLDAGAMQCGYCTPGMIVAAVSLLAANPHPSADDIVQGMSGNICRCGTYPRVIAAIQRAAGTAGTARTAAKAVSTP